MTGATHKLFSRSRPDSMIWKMRSTPIAFSSTFRRQAFRTRRFLIPSTSIHCPIRTFGNTTVPVARLQSLPSFTPKSSFAHRPRNFSTSATMTTEFSKQTISEGDKTNYPSKGQIVVMEYTGWLYDTSKPDNKGNQFDSSVGRGDFQTPIGVGRVIAGWDQGVPQMSLGERAILVIPGHMAYGDSGFPGLIPPNATLMFEVQLKGIR